VSSSSSAARRAGVSIFPDCQPRGGIGRCPARHNRARDLLTVVMRALCTANLLSFLRHFPRAGP
jgi:hypothetical protein